MPHLITILIIISCGLAGAITILDINKRHNKIHTYVTYFLVMGIFSPLGITTSSVLLFSAIVIFSTFKAFKKDLDFLIGCLYFLITLCLILVIGTALCFCVAFVLTVAAFS